MSGAVPSAFRSRLQSGEVVVGSFLNLGSSMTAEIMGVAGFEWLVVDLEHGAGDEHVLLTQLQALAHTGAAVLVRVEGLNGARVLHALDLGADGIVFPRIRAAAEAQQAVELCRYSGTRGVARYNRSWHWGLARRDLADADAEVVCVLQIETAEALQAVDEIAAIDGVDVLFVGPADLGHALNLHTAPDDPRLLSKAAAIADAAGNHGKSAGMLVGTVEQARAYRDVGFTFLGCGSDSSYLATEADRVATDMLELKNRAGIEALERGEAKSL
jgi:2-keto-3-deoxy-L-rhamnonate aldolase RhmA